MTADQPDDASNRFSTFVAATIALVSVVGAVIAWRVSVAAGDAGSADMRGVLALVDDATALTQASSIVLGHQISFAAFKANDRLADELAPVSQFAEVAEAFRSAAKRARNDYIPQAYIDRHEMLDASRDLAQNREISGYKKDTHPQPHFDAADRARLKAIWMMFALVWLGVAIVCLTLADAIRNALRYVFLVLGLGVFALGGLLAILVEIVA